MSMAPASASLLGKCCSYLVAPQWLGAQQKGRRTCQGIGIPGAVFQHPRQPHIADLHFNVDTIFDVSIFLPDHVQSEGDALLADLQSACWLHSAFIPCFTMSSQADSAMSASFVAKQAEHCAMHRDMKSHLRHDASQTALVYSRVHVQQPAVCSM